MLGFEFLYDVGADVVEFSNRVHWTARKHTFKSIVLYRVHPDDSFFSPTVGANQWTVAAKRVVDLPGTTDLDAFAKMTRDFEPAMFDRGP